MYEEDDDCNIILEEEEKKKLIQKRFLWFLCDGNKIDNTWACKCPFSVGIIILSFFICFILFFDVYHFWEIWFNLNWVVLFVIMLIIRLVSNIFIILGIIFVIISFLKNSYKISVLAYYSSIISLISNTILSIYILIFFFSYEFVRKIIGFTCIFWFTDELLYFLFCWFVFCNMIIIQRINYQLSLTTLFVF